MALFAEKYSALLFAPDMTIIPFKSGTAELEHGQEYKIGIFNHDADRDIDAAIEIRGKLVGSFRVKASSNIVVERPARAAYKLTFFAAESEEGYLSNLAGIGCSEPFVVTISVQKKELTSRSPYCCDGLTDYDGQESFGGTGLGARSDQRFVQSEKMRTESQQFVLIGDLKLKRCPKARPL